MNQINVDIINDKFSNQFSEFIINNNEMINKENDDIKKVDNLMTSFNLVSNLLNSDNIQLKNIYNLFLFFTDKFVDINIKINNLILLNIDIISRAINSKSLYINSISNICKSNELINLIINPKSFKDENLYYNQHINSYNDYILFYNKSNEFINKYYSFNIFDIVNMSNIDSTYFNIFFNSSFKDDNFIITLSYDVNEYINKHITNATNCLTNFELKNVHIDNKHDFQFDTNVINSCIQLFKNLYSHLKIIKLDCHSKSFFNILHLLFVNINKCVEFLSFISDINNIYPNILKTDLVFSFNFIKSKFNYLFKIYPNDNNFISCSIIIDNIENLINLIFNQISNLYQFYIHESNKYNDNYINHVNHFNNIVSVINNLIISSTYCAKITIFISNYINKVCQ